MLFETFCAALLLSSRLAQAKRFGVGYSLSYNYAVASVVYDDGTTLNIAKIAGYGAYQRAMEAATFPDYVKVIPPEPRALWDPELTCGRESSGLYDSIPRAPLDLEESYDRIPTWEEEFERGRATTALTAMLRALKMATEAAMDTEVDQAYIAVPFPVAEAFNERLRLASSSAGLDFPGFAVSAATVFGRSMKHDCSVEPSDPGARKPRPEMVVVEELNNHALTATVATVDCDSFEIHGILNSEKYGARELFNPFMRDMDGNDYPEREAQKQGRFKRKRELWRDALNRLVYSGRSDKIKIPGIDRLIFIGEAATPELQHVYRKSFGERLQPVTKPDSYGYLDNADRAYTVAREIARHALNNETFWPET